MFHYLRRIKELGFNGLKDVWLKHQRKKTFRYRWRQNSLAQKAGFSWADISREYNAPKNFDVFFEKIRQDIHLENVINHELFVKHLPDIFKNQHELLQKADHIAQGCIHILGFGEHCFDKNLTWHEDVFFGQSKTFESFKEQFYQDIKIPLVTSQETSNNDRNPDIKIPWELSRFNHLFVLSMAYDNAKKHSHNEYADRYAKAFQRQVSHWLRQNPYLLGVNWLCPMDVGIRAINLIWAIHFFKKEPSINISFFEKLICSLFSHMEYLEYNFETSDRPNNHYLADLLGYLYLSTFFSPIKKIYQKREHALKLLIEQLNHQILPDGTSYEGSTAYHNLDTEIFLHALVLGTTHQLEIPFIFKHRLNQMLSFARDTMINETTPILIGDNDSGKIVFGLKIRPHQHDLIKHYQDFGLSIIKKNKINLTFRHPTYAPYQPSGHFHNDQLGITLAINEQPIIVDPGSYCYTSQPMWRNKFRDFSYHNTLYCSLPEEGQSTNKDLFQLNRPQEQSHSIIFDNESTIELVDWYQAHKDPDIRANRSIHINALDNQIILYDWWNAEYTPKGTIINWSFMIAPEIDAIYIKQDDTWLFINKNKTIATMKTTIEFEKKEGWFSHSYGIKQPCIMLSAKYNFISDKQKTVFSANRN